MNSTTLTEVRNTRKAGFKEVVRYWFPFLDMLAWKGEQDTQMMSTNKFMYKGGGKEVQTGNAELGVSLKTAD